jgi:hypothetical protein
LANVNGAVRLTGATGSGEIKTVNGDVTAAFARTPGRPSSFRTVNGDIDVTFPDALSANLEFRTMHGEVLTDFDVESLAQPPAVERDRDGPRTMVRMNRTKAFRVGSGGAAHSFHTLNGDIYVRKASR